MEAFASLAVGYVSRLVELLAAFIVGYGALQAFYRVVILKAFRKSQIGFYDMTRIDLGRKLVLGLEFELGADLLQTAITPTWSHIGVLGAIIVLRTLLNFILERDIKQSEDRIGNKAMD